MAGKAAGKRKTIIDDGLLYLTVQEGDPRMALTFAGNMGQGIRDVNDCLAAMGLPCIEEMRAGCPSFSEKGSPDYLYKAKVRIDELSAGHRQVLAELVRRSNEARRAREHERQSHALTSHAKALVVRARNLVEEHEGTLDEAGRRSWELRAEQALRAFAEELG